MSPLRWRLASHEEGARMFLIKLKLFVCNCCVVFSPCHSCVRILSSLYFIVRTYVYVWNELHCACMYIIHTYIPMCGCGNNLVYYKQMANWLYMYKWIPGMHYSCVYVSRTCHEGGQPLLLIIIYLLYVYVVGIYMQVWLYTYIMVSLACFMSTHIRMHMSSTFFSWYVYRYIFHTQLLLISKSTTSTD